jgi:hypothetical protein
MKHFAGSSITYYGLAREKVMNKYPRLANILTILALICMTGFALFLISDLVSFASNSDHTVGLAGIDIAQNTEGKPISTAEALNAANNSDTNENLSLQINMSKMNGSSSSSQAGRGIIYGSASSSSGSKQSIDEKGSNSINKKHHSSSSPSSSSTSSAPMPTKESNEMPLTNQLNISDIAGSGKTGDLPFIGSVNDSQSDIKKGLASLSLGDWGSILIPNMEASPREPAVMIQFKTLSDSGTLESVTSLDSGNVGESSGDLEDNLNRQSGIQSDSSQETKVTASGQAQKKQQARAEQMAIRNMMADSIKKKAAQLRSKNTEDEEQNPNLQVGKQSDSSQEGKMTGSSQAQKARQAKAEQIASRKKMVESMKEKAAQSRAKAASK